MSYCINEIHCSDCGKFILTEEQEDICGDIKCIVGSYDNGYYYGKEDVFYCKDCAAKRGLE